MAAICVIAFSVGWVVLNKQGADKTDDMEAYAACLDRRQDSNLIVEICTQMIDAGVSSEMTLSALHVERGYALDDLDKWQQAIVDFDRAIALNPENYEAWQGKSFALDGLDQDIAALEAVETSLAIEPTKKYSVRRKFRLLRKLERYEEADEYYTQLMEKYPALEQPRHYWMPQQLGRMRLALEQHAAAAEVLRIAVLAKPSDQNSRSLFFRACIALGPECPSLTGQEAEAVSPERCTVITENLAETHPDFWASLHPDTREVDEARETQANGARLTIIEGAFVSHSQNILSGEAKQADAESYLLFAGLRRCVEGGVLFNPVAPSALKPEIEQLHGGAVGQNVSDLAHLLAMSK
ncbi:lipoprotein NlpI [Roseovarius albus]|uniref:Lipoprotein NlpI n=1 Tax=Roseovarius albus TaxID=1247867 RepID=A0A1X6Y4U7_9RHOB|nr:lipoprotein NlpI [Roseovarius albus]